MRHFAFSFLCRQSNSSIFYGFNSHFDNFERGYKERAKCNFKARNHLTAKSSRSYLFTSIQCKIQSFPYPSRKNPCKSFLKKQILFLANLSLIHFAFTNLHCSFFCCSEKVFGTEVKKAKSVCTLFISKEKFFRL